jgi:nucleotide-binding universal stress UspA family protein
MSDSRRSTKTVRLKILLALDGSMTSARAVEHASEILRACPSCEIMLFHVLTIPFQLLEREGLVDWDKEPHLRQMLAEARDRWVGNARDQIEQEVFNLAKHVLRQKGVRENGANIRTKVVADGRPHVARAICAEVERGGYDVVVLGRKRRSRLREFLSECVAHKVICGLSDRTAHAIWVVE